MYGSKGTQQTIVAYKMSGGSVALCAIRLQLMNTRILAEYNVKATDCNMRKLPRVRDNALFFQVRNTILCSRYGTRAVSRTRQITQIGPFCQFVPQEQHYQRRRNADASVKPPGFAQLTYL
jgi:hypothetical protein